MTKDTHISVSIFLCSSHLYAHTYTQSTHTHTQSTHTYTQSTHTHTRAARPCAPQAHFEKWREIHNGAALLTGFQGCRLPEKEHVQGAPGLCQCSGKRPLARLGVGVGA